MVAPAFPSHPAHQSVAVAVRGGESLWLRPADDDDLEFLRRLYRTFRAAEMAPLPWTQPAKDAFLDDQFLLQHRHFTSVFADADFRVVEQAGAPIGRLYLDRGSDRFLLIDIGLLPALCGRGLGRTLLDWVLAEAGDAGAASVGLHVRPENLAARRLYERCGFEMVGVQDPGHLRMECRVS